ncbi:ABC transporter substrate-binding protein [uncultured Friedmanniella sp.]|uniref:taurine ABC transporter substrate-binding protein n=1 Tax=uncultured Friedmanniella sp. TaxID=335381 RepID=UPI0035CC1061
MHPRRRFLRALGAGLAATSLVTLAACGGGGGAAAPEDKTIRIAYQKFPSGDLIVKNQGLLEKALPDYKIEWKVFDSGASINTAYVAKAVDVAAIGSSPVARGLSGPLNLPYKVAFILDVAGDNEALVASNASGVTKVADLRGKKIATSFSSTAHYSLLVALKQAGLTEQDVTLVDLEPQDILAAWKRGDIDAAYTWLPNLDELRKTGKTLVASKDLATAGKPTLDLGVVSDAFISAHPEAVDAWRKAEAQALTTIKDQPDQANQAVAAELGITPEEAAGQLKQGVYLTSAELTSPTWLGTEQSVGKASTYLHDAAVFLAEQKQIPAAPDQKVFDDAIYRKGLSSDLN